LIAELREFSLYHVIVPKWRIAAKPGGLEVNLLVGHVRARNESVVTQDSRDFARATTTRRVGRTCAHWTSGDLMDNGQSKKERTRSRGKGFALLPPNFSPSGSWVLRINLGSTPIVEVGKTNCQQNSRLAAALPRGPQPKKPETGSRVHPAVTQSSSRPASQGL